MKNFNLSDIQLTKYSFFTGKGGVGKTSIACATAVGLADLGKKILLISTDPASNLQDVFGQELNGHGTDISEVPGLVVVNLDPEKAAAEYRESVISPYRGKLPESVIRNMEEQLSGSCTVEIAAFNEFSDFITDEAKQREYDHIIFDTAPTGHTLRMLQLPSACTFISESTHGASCLGQLSGLEERKGIYKQAVSTLSDEKVTSLVLVARPDLAPLKEAARSSHELNLLGIKNQILIINGVLQHSDDNDNVTRLLSERQNSALYNIPEELKGYPMYSVPLRSYNLSNIENIRKMLSSDNIIPEGDYKPLEGEKNLDDLVDDLFSSGKRVIFTMGKGGVGKTTIATNIALKLKERGAKVHLTTTDPANHLNYDLAIKAEIDISKIDEAEVLEAYKNEVRAKARENKMTAEDMEYIEEDLRSPCTQEIAVFKAFADIVEKADTEIVVIDTAPTGHTLLLLDATQSYHKEVERTQGEITGAVANLLPRLRNPKETEVVIVTLPETTPVFEAERLQQDLHRAGIENKWWAINSCLSLVDTQNPFLKAKAQGELSWIDRVKELSNNNAALIAWKEK